MMLEVVSLTDTNLGYQQVPLDLASSLLTTFNTSWGKFRLLKLKRLVDGVISIADDILIQGKHANHDHDARLLTLLETACMNNVTLNAKKFNFKSTDCPFFGHNLTPEGLKIDPKKVEAKHLMEAPTNIKDLQSFLGLVKYLNRSSANIAQIAEPLQRLCKKDTMPPQSWGDRSDTKHSKCLLLGGRRLNQLTLIPKPKGSGGARAAMAQVGPANNRNDTKRCLPIEASLRPGEAVPW